jgi:hypothetical protein
VGRNAAAGAYTLSADKFTLEKIGDLPAPLIGGIGLTDGAVIIGGTNGVPGSISYLLATTNLALPLSDWMRLATNLVGPTGGFSITTAMNPAPEQFYRLQLEP